jgi:predicted metalloprotease with PDZ domain
MSIRRLFILLLLIVAPATLAVAGTGAKSLKITFEPASNALYRVTIAFRGDTSGTTMLNLPNEWGGQSELFKSLRELRSENATITDTDKPYVKSLKHRPGQPITVSYLIAQDYQGPYRNAVRYRPVATAEYIHWIGNTVFAVPAWDDSAQVTAELDWRNFPSSWTIANSFGVSSRKQRFNGRLGDFLSGLFVAGDFRVSRTEAAGEPVYVAIRGIWNFKDSDLTAMISRVIDSQRRFWKDGSQKRYLVTLVQMDEGPNSSSFGGTGLTDSFALFSTPNATVSGLRGLLSHEYSHNWIPMKMGRMPDPEQSLYWFSEGFNEFYNYRHLVRSGIITRQEFVDEYNRNIREFYRLPTRTEPNERIVKDFWNDQFVQRLPYLRGLLFATNLNAAIERASGGKHSLDDAMFEIYRSKGAAPDAKLSFEFLAAVFGRYLGADPTQLMKRHLIDGELVAPEDGALGDGIVLEYESMDVFELGFDFDKFANDRVVTGVSPNSAAYDAGLREGQQRNGGVSVYFGDTTREIELKVKDAEGEKIVKFLPVAKERLRVPQFKLK